MSHLQIFLLGPSHLVLEGVSLSMQRRKAFALLAYLTDRGVPQPRDSLATLLWPESSQSEARKALRRDLSELNLSLGGGWIEATRENVGLRPGFWLDVAEFQRLAAQEDTDSLLAAAALYRGDFLAGFTLPDCSAFDEWQYFQSEGLRQTFAKTLDRLVTCLSRQAAYEPAIPHARRRVALDPLDEAAQRQLMRLYAQAGQQGAALRQYDLLRQTLDEELGVAPSDETVALYGEIHDRRVQVSAASSPVPPHNHIPTQTTTFIGRQDELAEIRRLLLHEPGCRLLSLVGPGGIGKTRLALAAMAQLREAFVDGVHFAPLAPVGEEIYVVQAIAHALGLIFFGSVTPKEQLLSHLAPKQLLLVLDNFEHLLEQAALLSDILARAPHVTVLATSRERLKLREEWVYDVPGLALPPAAEESNLDWAGYSAVELFTQRARQTTGNFAPTGAEMAALIRICRLVEGMPLALELAAPWTRTLSCHEIADEIQRSLDFLSTPLHNMPERHRSMGVVFTQTWQRLPDEERIALQCLSVFRGGCTRTAAEAAAGATLPVLSSLLDKALVRRTPLGRYELHELIRQFAEAQLQTDRQAVDEMKQRHQDFFISFLETRAAGVKGYRQTETLAEIEADIDNVRLAWARAVAARDSVAITRAAECLFIYFLYRNGYEEGILEFGRAMAAYAPNLPNRLDDVWIEELAIQEHTGGLVGFLLAGMGYFVAHRRDLQRGQKLLERALALLRRTASGDRRKVAFALLWLGWAHYFQGQLTEGKRYGSESLPFFAETADAWGEGWALLLLGACFRDGRPAEAEPIYQRGLTLCRQTGDQIALSYLSFNLGATLTALGRYAQAQPYLMLGLTISAKLNNILGFGYARLRQGQWEISQGTYRQAIQTLQQAWADFNKVGTVHASRAQLALGQAHYLQGDHVLAAQFYDQALEGFKAANNRFEQALCLNGLGCLAYDQGKLHQAEQLHRESLALLQETEPEPALVTATWHYLGRVLAVAGASHHDEARDCFRRALELAMVHQLAPLALDVCVDVAQLIAQMGETEHARDLLALVEQHESSSFAARAQARAMRVEGTTQSGHKATAPTLPPDADLWAVAQALMTELTTETE